jgi:O-antigen/teichoic acid export membrane protein
MVMERAQQARGARLSFAVQVAGVAVSYTVQVVLARALGPRGFGTYSYVLAWCGPLSMAAGLGLPTVALRFLPVYRDEGDEQRVAALVATSERIALAASTAIAVIGSGLAVWLVAEPEPLLVGLWTLPLAVQLKVQSELARSAARFRLAFVLPLVQQLVMLGAAVLAVTTFGRDLGPAGALLLPAVGAAVVVPWLRTAFRRGIRDELSATPHYEVRPWIAAGVAFLAVDAANTVLNQADSLLVGGLGGTKQLALFAAATGTASFAMLAMIAVGASTVPSFSRHWARGERAQLEAVAQRAVRWAFWPQLAVTLLLAAASGPILGLFGPTFVHARGALLLLFVGQLANTSTGYSGNLMNMTGHQRRSAQSIWIVAVFNVVAVTAGLKLAGVTGAAGGTAVSSLLWNMWLYRLVRRHVGVRPSILDAVLHRTLA